MALIWKPCCDSLLDSLPASSLPFFGHATGSYFPNQGSKLCSLQWKCDTLTTGPSGNSHLLFWYERLSSPQPVRAQFLKRTLKADSPPIPQSPTAGKLESPSPVTFRKTQALLTPLAGIHPTEVSAFLHQKMCKNVGSDFLHVSQKLGDTWMSINRTMNKLSYIPIMECHWQEETTVLPHRTT